MTDMQLEISLPWSEKELLEAVQAASRGSPSLLRALCRKEVASFEAKIREHPDYVDGLVRIEKFAVEGYLYQKLRGHLDEKTQTNDLPEEG